MIRTIIWYIKLFIAGIGIFPHILANRRTHEWGSYDYHGLEKSQKYWSGVLMRAAGFELDVAGAENIPEGPVLFAGNHQGMFDVFCILNGFGKMFPIIAKKETRKLPVIGIGMEGFDCVFLDRANPRKGLEAMKKAQELLEAGQSVVIFPEGTRSRGKGLGEFKAGALQCAVKAKVPVVPFAINGTWHAMEETGYITPTRAKMRIMKPIETASLDRAEAKQLSGTIQELVREEIERMQAQAARE